MICHLRKLSEVEEEPNPFLTADCMSVHQDNTRDNIVIDSGDETYFSYNTEEDEDHEAILEFLENEASESDSESCDIPEGYYDPTFQSAGKLTVIKKGSSYITMINSHYRILDILCFMPAGTTYDGFLKAFQSKSKKWIFPFAQLTSFEALNGPIPPYPGAGWWNELKNECSLDGEYQKWLKTNKKSPKPQTGEEKYQEILELCRQNNYTTLRSYLIGYNCSDVGPGVLAVGVMIREFFSHKVDMFMETCTVAGIARKILFRYAKENHTHFPLIAQRDADLHYLIRGSITGGVSSIYTRKCIKGETYLTPEKKHLSNNIEIYDSNALYTYCLQGSFMTQTYLRRHASENFKPCPQTRLIKQHAWLRFVQEKMGIDIKTSEKVGMDVTYGKYRVDGMHTDENNTITVYEFKGETNHSLISCKTNKN